MPITPPLGRIIPARAITSSLALRVSRLTGRIRLRPTATIRIRFERPTSRAPGFPAILASFADFGRWLGGNFHA
jgi:hypothetical protein